MCVVLCAGLHGLFDGKAAADVVALVLRHYYRACGWGTAHFDAAISCVQYGTAGDVLAAGDSDGRIHFICAQTGKKILCPLSWHNCSPVDGSQTITVLSQLPLTSLLPSGLK